MFSDCFFPFHQNRFRPNAKSFTLNGLMQLIVVEILLVEFDSVARFGCRRSVVTQLTSEFCLMFVAFNTFHLFHRLVLMFGQMHLILFESNKMRSQTIDISKKKFTSEKKKKRKKNA